MEPLSRNKKIGILSLVVLSITLVGLFFTGNLSFSGLKSDVLNQSCTEQGQKNRLPQYTVSLNKRDQAQKTLEIASGEVAVLNTNIASNNESIADKQTQIEKKKTNIAELTTDIEKNCKGRSANSPLCREKIQQKKNLIQDLRVLNNAVLTLQNTNDQLSRKIQNNQRIITQQLQLIARLNPFIEQYESCDRQLKIKPILTSPLASGEVSISFDQCASGEVRVPIYHLTVTEPSPGRAVINWIDFNMTFGNPDTIQLTDLYVTEEGQSEPLYKCFFLDQDQTRLNCLPGTESIVNSEARRYILSARVTSMTGPGFIKIYGANIAYNGRKVDAINQTTTIKINYAPNPVKTEIQYVSQFGTDQFTTAQLGGIRDMVFDAAGNIYATDAAHNLVRKFNSSGVQVSQFDVKSDKDVSMEPFGIAIDTTGNIYVTTHQYPIIKFSNSGQYLIHYALDQNIRNPKDITLDNEGNMYVVDNGNNRVVKINNSGTVTSVIGSRGSNDGQFNTPTYIALDSNGNIYVSDEGNHRIQKFSNPGVFVAKFGTQGFNLGQLYAPKGISLDVAGNIYIATTNRIQKYTSNGLYITQFQEQSASYRPQGISMDSAGNIYVIDNAGNHIQKFAQVAVCENNKPSITLISPNGGDKLELGKYLYPKPFIKYDVENAPENSWVALSLYKNGVALGYITLGADISYKDGIDWQVGTYVDYIGGTVHMAPAGNDYTIEAMLYTGEKPVGKVPQIPAQTAITFDRSDAVFSLVSSPASTCTDSDGGKNINLSGVSTGLSVFPDEGTTSKEDYCIAKKPDGSFNLDPTLRDPYWAGKNNSCTSNCAVQEYSCSPSTIISDVVNCPNGCNNGACLPPPTLTHSWMVGPWGACPNGTQDRSVTCQNNLGNTVTDSYCNTGTKPINTQSCSTLVACTDTRPLNSTIKMDIGTSTTSIPWRYDGNPDGPYPHCTFQCNSGTKYTATTNTCDISPVTYAVTYNGNGQTGGILPIPQTKIPGTMLIISNNTGALTRIGYTFAGWNTAPDGSGTNYPTGASHTSDVSVTLYAKWVPLSPPLVTYTVTFDSQSATKSANPTTITVTFPATTISTLPITPVKTGFIFAGWYTAVDGGGTAFVANTPVTANTTVYAKWVPIVLE